MDYTDFIKYLKQNLPDDKSLAYLAKIEKEHGKEAVIASVTGPIVSLNPEPTEPETFFDLLYYFPDLVYSGNNDLSYTKTLSTSSFLWPQGTSMYLNNDSTFVVDPNNQKDYFVFCVHIHRQSIDPNYKINFHIGLPNYTSDAGSYQYLIFNQLPNTTLYIPDHRDRHESAYYLGQQDDSLAARADRTIPCVQLCAELQDDRTHLYLCYLYRYEGQEESEVQSEDHGHLSDSGRYHLYHTLSGFPSGYVGWLLGRYSYE